MSESIDVATHLLLAFACLSAPQYQAREAADCALRQSLPLSVPLLEAAMKGSDAEASVRARSILTKWYWDTAEAKAAVALPTGYPRIPWIDFPKTDPWAEKKQEYYLEMARQHTKKYDEPPWNDWRLAARLYITDLYRDMRTAGKVQAELDRMRDAEIDWIRRKGHRYNPPLEVPK